MARRDVWARPAECDEWIITSTFHAKKLFSRKPIYKATATGLRRGREHALYMGTLSKTSVGWGETREAAEREMRAIICRDIKAYQGWLDRKKFKYTKFSADDVCPC